jgi:hypothetical protein
LNSKIQKPIQVILSASPGVYFIIFCLYVPPPRLLRFYFAPAGHILLFTTQSETVSAGGNILIYGMRGQTFNRKIGLGTGKRKMLFSSTKN